MHFPCLRNTAPWATALFFGALALVSSPRELHACAPCYGGYTVDRNTNQLVMLAFGGTCAPGSVSPLGPLERMDNHQVYAVSSIDLTFTDGHLYGVATDGNGADLLDIDPLTGAVFSVTPLTLPGGAPAVIQLAEGLASSAGQLLVGFKQGSPPEDTDSNYLGVLDRVTAVITGPLNFAGVGAYASTGAPFNKPDFDGLMTSSVVPRFVSSDHAPAVSRHAFHEISYVAPDTSLVGIVNDNPPSNGLAVNDLDESECLPAGGIAGINGGQSTPPTDYKAVVGIDRTDGSIDWEVPYAASLSLHGLAGYDTAKGAPFQFCLLCPLETEAKNWNDGSAWTTGGVPGASDDVIVLALTLAVGAPESGGSAAQAGRLRVGSGNVVSPGDPARVAVSSTGELTVATDLILRSGGELSIAGDTPSVQAGTLDAAGAPTLTWTFGPAGPSTLVVSGEAKLAGTLSIALQGGFVPEPGDFFTLLTAATLSGQFANAPSRVATPTGSFAVIYGPSSVTLTDFEPAPPVPFSAPWLAPILLATGIVALRRRSPARAPQSPATP